MPFLASTQNRSSKVLSTSGPHFVALEQFAPNSLFIVLTALNSGDSHDALSAEFFCFV